MSPTTQYQCGHEPTEDPSHVSSSFDDDCPEQENIETHEEEEEAGEALESLEEGGLDMPPGGHHSSEGVGSDKDSTPNRTLTTNSLQQEFELLNLSLGSIKFDEDPNSSRRSCKFIATVPANQVLHRVCLIAQFPPDYPQNVAPHFTFGKGTTLGSGSRSKIIKAMKHLAMEKVRKNKTCLDQCLRLLENMLEDPSTFKGMKIDSFF